MFVCLCVCVCVGGGGWGGGGMSCLAYIGISFEGGSKDSRGQNVPSISPDNSHAQCTATIIMFILISTVMPEGAVPVPVPHKKTQTHNTLCYPYLTRHNYDSLWASTPKLLMKWQSWGA